jgi:hypothetical protein
MKVVLVGSVEFSLRVLEKLIAIDVDLVGVCTKKSSTFNSDFFDLKPLCDINEVPCLYVDISEFMDKKIKIMNIYEGEINKYPFPRSERSIRALATYRGATSSCDYAESFMLLKEIS